jgi:allophanate hydrolase subunit 2
VIVVEHVAGVAMIQDLGRPGRMHEGLAPGGALVPELLIHANRALGNRDGAPAFEVFGRLRLRVERALVVHAGTPQQLAAGDELRIESGGSRVAYLAVRGGVAAARICGGCGVQLSAGIGAVLRGGDRLQATTEWVGQGAELPAPVLVSDDPIHVIAGPDVVAGALEALLAGVYRIAAASDRVGTRLDGPVVPAPAGTGVSRPMTRGAIELPPDGRPIVLGPEHPTTGGYPVIAVVATIDQGKLFARPIGAHVRFTAGAVR